MRHRRRTDPSRQIATPGTACRFDADIAREGRVGTDGPAGQVWIQGGLHAENFGSHMASTGRLVYDVNDFDEAELGHFDWGRQARGGIGACSWTPFRNNLILCCSGGG